MNVSFAPAAESVARGDLSRQPSAPILSTVYPAWISPPFSLIGRAASPLPGAEFTAAAALQDFLERLRQCRLCRQVLCLETHGETTSRNSARAARDHLYCR